MSSYTKGNWKATYFGPVKEGATKVMILDHFSGGFRFIAETYGSGMQAPLEELEANAKLIAAAPKLLQSLIDCRQAMIDSKRFNEKSIQILSIIKIQESLIAL